MPETSRPKPTMHKKAPAPMRPMRMDLVTSEQALPGMEVSVQDEKQKNPQNLPPIRLQSPDGQRVIEVRDPSKATSMTNKGWTLTDKPKTPYKAPEHMTQRPFGEHEGLADLQRSMNHPQLTKRQKSVIRRATKNITKKEK